MTKVLLAPPALGTVLSLTGLPGGSNKIHDRSPYGNVGTIVGATWAKLPGGLWCLSFDGSDDYVNCGNASSLNPTTAMTLMAWVYLTGGLDTDHRLVMCRDASNQRMGGLYVHMNNKRLEFYVSKSATGNFTVLSATTGDWVYNTWNFVAAIYQYVADGTSIMRLFKDSLEVGSTSSAVGPLATTSSNTEIGRKGFTVDRQWWQGYIALARIFNRSMTALEIRGYFDQEKHLFGVWQT